MQTAVRSICLLVIVLTIRPAIGQEARRPRILILGDSVYRQPASEVAKELKGKAEVVYRAMKDGEVCNTSSTLENLDELLGESNWDVIHFNCGLGDLVYRAPGMKAFRVMSKHAGGRRATSPEQYEKNLRRLVQRLKATDARLVWASTTPIRKSTCDLFELGSEVEYNAIAAKVMAEFNVPTNDMYEYVRNLIDMKRPASHGADPFHFDKKPIHPPIVKSIQDALNRDRVQ